MELVYSEDELISIDSAIPMDRWEEFPPSEHVMNYNNASIFGEIENLIKVGMLREKIGVCLHCDSGTQYIDTSANCDKPIGDCCGGCGYDQECEHCDGGITIN